MIELRVQHRVFTSEGLQHLRVDARMKEGELVCVSGKSGRGKSTFFAILAGLTDPDHAFFSVNGQVLTDTNRGVNVPPQRRNLALMFQDYALFPTMSARQNIAFAQKEKDLPYLDYLLEALDLTLLQNARVGSLSGGQKQRIALARALAQRSKLLLLDEPFSAVDSVMKKTMMEEVLRYRAETGATVFIITHQPDDFTGIQTNEIKIQ